MTFCSPIGPYLLPISGTSCLHRSNWICGRTRPGSVSSLSVWRVFGCAVFSRFRASHLHLKSMYALTLSSTGTGVYFFSLDASSRLAVRVARRFFHLPYFDARMGVRRDGNWIRYITSRNDNSSARAEFRGSYRASGSMARAQPGTFDNWLTERYCFYTLDSTLSSDPR